MLKTYALTQDLPPEGEGYETSVLDLKATPGDVPIEQIASMPLDRLRALLGDPKRRFQMAKDVAAFANHLGGAILVGLQESSGRVGRDVPLSEDQANVIRASYSEAVRDRCLPRPDFDPIPIRRGQGFVVAVNVQPFVGQIVGVATKSTEFGDDAFVFPVRSGVDAVYLSPERLSMFFEPKLRRHIVLLNRIPASAVVSVYVSGAQGGESLAFEGSLIGIDPYENAVRFEHSSGDGGTTRKAFPLDHVERIFKGVHARDYQGRWNVCFRM
jgi:hypothetical protein